MIYVGSDDGSVYAINATTGAKIWSYATGSPVPSSPAGANNLVYAGNTGGTLYALKASTGKKAWGYTPLHGQLHGFPRGGGRARLRRGHVLLHPRRRCGHGHASLVLPNGFYSWSTAAVVNGELYVGSSDDNICTRSAFDGSPLPEAHRVARPRRSPAAG